MSKPEGTYSETHSLLSCWHEEIKKINQLSFLSVWWMIHYLCSSVLTLITVDILHTLTAAFFYYTVS